MLHPNATTIRASGSGGTSRDENSVPFRCSAEAQQVHHLSADVDIGMLRRQKRGRDLPDVRSIPPAVALVLNGCRAQDLLQERPPPANGIKSRRPSRQRTVRYPRGRKE